MIEGYLKSGVDKATDLTEHWIPPENFIVHRTLSDIVDGLRKCSVEDMETVIEVGVVCGRCGRWS